MSGDLQMMANLEVKYIWRSTDKNKSHTENWADEKLNKDKMMTQSIFKENSFNTEFQGISMCNQMVTSEIRE